MLCLYLPVSLCLVGILSFFLSKCLRRKIYSSQNNSAAAFHSAIFYFPAPVVLDIYFFWRDPRTFSIQDSTKEREGETVSLSTLGLTGRTLLYLILSLRVSMPRTQHSYMGRQGMNNLKKHVDASTTSSPCPRGLPVTEGNYLSTK